MKSYSEETAALIDEEVKRIFDKATADCEKLLDEHREIVIAVAEYLLAHETMDGDDFNYFCDHGELPPPKPAPKLPDGTIEPPARKITCSSTTTPPRRPRRNSRGGTGERAGAGSARRPAGRPGDPGAPGGAGRSAG
jgi:hypothetical protein